MADNQRLQRENQDTDVKLPDKLNTFFAHFEDNTVPPKQLVTNYCWFSFSMANMSKTFKCVNPRKAAGPVGIPSRFLRACAEQLAGVFTGIFNLSLSKSAVPTCFKRGTIVPVPKKAKVTELNYFRPVALTSVIMKCCERLVKDHHLYLTCHPRPTPNCLPPQQVHRRCNHHHTAHCPIPPGQEEYLCKNAVH